MNIDKSKLLTIWYEDENQHIIPSDPDSVEYYDKSAVTKHVRFPCMIVEDVSLYHFQEDVDKCNHPDDQIVPTTGWIDGVEGRKCKLCNGTQIRKVGEEWPSKWDVEALTPLIAFRTTWNDILVLAMANSGDFTLHDAIIVATTACERCVNALCNKYLPNNKNNGYPEFSDEWKASGMHCDFCKDLGFYGENRVPMKRNDTQYPTDSTIHSSVCEIIPSSPDAALMAAKQLFTSGKIVTASLYGEQGTVSDKN